MSALGLEYGSVVKSTSCFCRGHTFGSQHPHVFLQSPVTLVLKDLMPSPALHGHSTQVIHRNTQANTYIHKNNLKKDERFLKKKKSLMVDEFMHSFDRCSPVVLAIKLLQYVTATSYGTMTYKNLKIPFSPNLTLLQNIHI